MKKQGKIFYGWWILVGCILITTTMVPVVMAMFNKYLLAVTGDLQISRSAFTMCSTITQGLGIFISPFVAKKLATGNLKKIQALGVVGFAAAYASYSLAQNVIHLYISSFILGICFLCSTLIPVSMIITNWFVKKRGLAMSIAMTGIGVGGFILSPVITTLITTYSWRLTYQILAVAILVIALPTVLFVLKSRPEDMGLTAYGAEEKANVSQTNGQSADHGVRLSVKDSYLKPFFIVMLLGMFCNGLINTGALGQFPPALQELHGPVVQASIISLYSLIGIFGKLIVGWLDDKFGLIASVVFGCTTFTLSLICMYFGENLTAVYGMAVFFGLGLAIGTVSPPLVTSAVFGTKKYAEAYGVANSATQIGLSLGSLLVAQIFDRTGSYQPAWLLLAVLTVATLVLWVTSYQMSQRYK